MRTRWGEGGSKAEQDDGDWRNDGGRNEVESDEEDWEEYAPANGQEAWEGAGNSE